MVSKNPHGDWDWDYRLNTEPMPEETPKKPRQFTHRAPESKCGRCQLKVRAQGRFICQGSGRVLDETSGCGQCAFVEVSRDGSD